MAAWNCRATGATVEDLSAMKNGWWRRTMLPLTPTGKLPDAVECHCRSGHYGHQSVCPKRFRKASQHSVETGRSGMATAKRYSCWHQRSKEMEKAASA